MSGDQELRDAGDPRALRAFAHPIRLKLLEELHVDGPATATELAERVGESPANCSWHLRQLARYGYIVEAGGGTGRQRPWRAVLRGQCRGHGDGQCRGHSDGQCRGHGEQPAELATASDEASDVLLTREYEAFRDWLSRRRAEPAQWREAGFVAQSVGWLTAEELRRLRSEMSELLLRHAERLDPATRPPGARPVRFVAWGVPARPASD